MIVVVWEPEEAREGDKEKKGVDVKTKRDGLFGIIVSWAGVRKSALVLLTRGNEKRCGRSDANVPDYYPTMQRAE
jgi:hypothetical protein